MARLAGSSSSYRVGILDAEGKATPHTWDFPSVTHILDTVIAKPRLMNWYYKVAIQGVAELYRKYGAKLPHDEQSIHDLLKTNKLTPWAFRDAGGDAGKAVHSKVEAWAVGLGDDSIWTPDDRGFPNWLRDRGLDRGSMVASEVPLVSFKNQFAGTVDLIYREPVTDMLVLTDVKTGRYVQWTHLVQCQAYKIAWEEQGGEPILLTSVLHIRPESEIPAGWKEYTTDVLEPDCFLRVLDVYRSLPEDWIPEEIQFEPQDATPVAPKEEEKV